MQIAKKMIDFTIGPKYANIVVTESADMTKVHSNALQNLCQRAWNSTALTWNGSFGFILRYMPQVSYRIPQICRVGFPRNSARQLADFHESSVESSQTIRGNIAGYLRNLRMYLRYEGLPRNIQKRNLCNPL